jgi:tRNA synthetases class I (W and Y)
MSVTILTGIKPTGSPHLANYIGAIKPALDLAQGATHALYFIANYHALTAIHDPRELDRLIYEVAATWLALGLDPEKVIFYRQSDIPEIFELTWILPCMTAKGLMNRAHAYKAVVARNRERKAQDDAGVNMGLYAYPILMAADILLSPRPKKRRRCAGAIGKALAGARSSRRFSMSSSASSKSPERSTKISFSTARAWTRSSLAGPSAPAISPHR